MSILVMVQAFIVSVEEMDDQFISPQAPSAYAHSLVMSLPKPDLTYLFVHLNRSQAILPFSLMQAAKSLRIVPLALSHR